MRTAGLPRSGQRCGESRETVGGQGSGKGQVTHPCQQDNLEAKEGW